MRGSLGLLLTADVNLTSISSLKNIFAGKNIDALSTYFPHFWAERREMGQEEEAQLKAWWCKNMQRLWMSCALYPNLCEVEYFFFQGFRYTWRDHCTANPSQQSRSVGRHLEHTNTHRMEDTRHFKKYPC